MGGMGQFFQQRFDLAVPKLHAGTQQLPSYPSPYRFLAACHAHMGQLAEARAALAKLRGINAAPEQRVSQWRVPEHRALLLSGLRLAAGPAAMTQAPRPAGTPGAALRQERV